MKHVPCSEEYKESINYPYHPAVYEDSEKCWCIHSYYCTDLLESNETVNNNYSELVLSVVDKPTFESIKKLYTVAVNQLNFVHLPDKNNKIKLLSSCIPDNKKEEFARDHFRSIFNKIFICQPGHAENLSQVKKVGNYYKLNGIPCYKYLKQTGSMDRKRKQSKVEIFLKYLYFGTDYVQYHIKEVMFNDRDVQKRFKFFFHFGFWSPHVVFKYDDVSFLVPGTDSESSSSDSDSSTPGSVDDNDDGDNDDDNNGKRDCDNLQEKECSSSSNTVVPTDIVEKKQSKQQFSSCTTNSEEISKGKESNSNADVPTKDITTHVQTVKNKSNPIVMYDTLYGDRVIDSDSDSDSDASDAPPTPDKPDLIKQKFVSRIASSHGEQYRKSQDFYSKYVTSTEYKNSGLRIPLYPDRLCGDEICMLAGNVYVKLVTYFHNKKTARVLSDC